MHRRWILQSKKLLNEASSFHHLYRQHIVRDPLHRWARNHGGSSSTRSCPRCGSPISSCCALFCPSANCSYIQPIDCVNCQCNYFELFQIHPIQFDINTTDLESKFKNLQKKVHPDKLASTLDEAGIDVARGNSAFIDQVYQTLKHPLRRATYLLSLRGIHVDDEGKTLSDPQLTMEMFELREELEDLVTRHANPSSSSISSSSASESTSTLPPAVAQFGRRLEQSVAALEARLSALFALGDYPAAATATVRLKYMEKAQEEFRDKFNV